MKKHIFSLIICLCTGGLLGAHEFFVIPNEVRAYKAGDTVQLNALSTHYFTVGEELEPVEVNEVYAVKNGGKSGGNLPLKANPDRLWYETAYRITDDIPVTIVGNRKGGFYCLFTDGSTADGARAEVAAANPGKTIAAVHYFAKYSKYYLNPSSSDRTFSTPLGHDLEIIPLDNPAKITKGFFAKARFRVLYKGKPLSNAEISATYDHYNSKTPNAYAQTGRTDANGEAVFRIDNTGLWLVRVSDTRPSAYPNTNLDNNAALLVFVVK